MNLQFDNILGIIIPIAGLFLLYILCRVFLKQIKWLLRFIMHCGIGCLAMVLVNLVSPFANISFSINPLTAVISGTLGAPGLVMTLILKNIL